MTENPYQPFRRIRGAVDSAKRVTDERYGAWELGYEAARADLLASSTAEKPSEEDAIRDDERERLSARVYENGWCPTCAWSAERDFARDAKSHAAGFAAAVAMLREPDEELLRALEEAAIRVGTAHASTGPEDAHDYYGDLAESAAAAVASVLERRTNEGTEA